LRRTRPHHSCHSLTHHFDPKRAGDPEVRGDSRRSHQARCIRQVGAYWGRSREGERPQNDGHMIDRRIGPATGQSPVAAPGRSQFWKRRAAIWRRVHPWAYKSAARRSIAAGGPANHSIASPRPAPDLPHSSRTGHTNSRPRHTGRCCQPHRALLAEHARQLTEGQSYWWICRYRRHVARLGYRLCAMSGGLA
jgi:hypothetical protein